MAFYVYNKSIYASAASRRQALIVAYSIVNRAYMDGSLRFLVIISKIANETA